MTPTETTGAARDLEGMSSQAVYQHRRVRAGQCAACGANPVPPGSWRCPSCQAIANRRHRDRRQLLAALRQCFDCRAKMPDAKFRRCLTCRLKVALRDRERRRAAKVAA